MLIMKLPNLSALSPCFQPVRRLSQQHFLIMKQDCLTIEDVISNYC